MIFPLLAISLALTTYDYFVRYAGDWDVRYWFDDAGAHLAAEVNRFTRSGWTGDEWIVLDTPPARDRRVFLDRGLWEGFVNTQFLVPHQSAVTLIKTGGDLPEPGLGPTLLLLWPYEDWRRDLALLPQQAMIEFRGGTFSKGDRDPKAIMTYLIVQAMPYVSPPEPLARFKGGLQLVGAQLQGPAQESWLRLLWYAPQTPDMDYAVFVHLQRGDTLTGQHDSDPAGGHYPTSQWRPGNIIVDEHDLSGRDTQGARVLVGLYCRDTGERLSVVDATGNTIGDSVTIVK